MIRRLFVLAAIAEILAILSYILYLPSYLLAQLSDYIFEFSGCSDMQEEDEQDIVDEMNNENKEEEDYG